ncbi:MAG: hypothetical protein WD038_06600, partial [Balneolales bacterium]
LCAITKAGSIEARTAIPNGPKFKGAAGTFYLSKSIIRVRLKFFVKCQSLLNSLNADVRF